MEKLNLKATGLDLSVIFVRSVKARRLRISIAPFKAVRITYPAKVSQKTAQEFFESNIEWVKKTVLRMKDIEQRAVKPVELPKIDVKQSAEYLYIKLKEIAEKHNFSFNRVFIRNQRTRWGSCSSKNNINLNINIVRLPAELQEYILLHELVHTRVKNHSCRFWDELEKYVANARQVAKKLRRHSLRSLHYAA